MWGACCSGEKGIDMNRGLLHTVRGRSDRFLCANFEKSSFPMILPGRGPDTIRDVKGKSDGAATPPAPRGSPARVARASFDKVQPRNGQRPSHAAPRRRIKSGTTWSAVKRRPSTGSRGLRRRRGSMTTRTAYRASGRVAHIRYRFCTRARARRVINDHMAAIQSISPAAGGSSPFRAAGASAVSR